MQIVLASQSPYRKAQLSAFGIPFEAFAPKVDEEALKKSGPGDLTELTRFLALKKAESLTGMFPGAVLIGSDQIAACEGERLDKPGTKERALAQLRRLSGRSHELITSIALVHNGRALVETEITRLRLRPLGDPELEAYLEQDEPYDCAGSYKIERAGLALVENVEGGDPSAIQGLPLIRLTGMLMELGFPPSQLWRLK